MATKSGRTIEYIQKKSLKDLLVRWETLLVFIFLAGHPPIRCSTTKH